MSEDARGTALYRRYRSQNFKDVVGQDHVTKTLENSLKQGRLSHAYLFVGPRGVGKTSVARILAHEANGLEYDGQSNHLDIVEIDAASNRGIDEIRDLRDKVHLAPSSAKYKVYIIDEVHMLTAPAFSALLKTLEEPPSHVIFIMATTEGHKIPATIISRAQRFSFLPLDTSLIEKHLAQVAKQEKLEAEPKALNLIAQYGFGSLRDSLGLLDQLAHQKNIKAKDAEQLIGLAPKKVVKDLLSAIDGRDSQAISNTVDQIRAQGVSPAIAARQLIEELRKRQTPSPEDVGLFNDLLEVATASEPELKLEVILLKYALSQEAPSARPAERVAADKPKSQPAESEAAKPQPASPSAELSQPQWQKILDTIKADYSSLYAVLRQAVPRKEDEGAILLEFKFNFHKNRASEDKNKRIIEKTAAVILGKPVSIKTKVNEDLEVPSAKGRQPSVSSVMDLMGGGDIMEYDDGR